MAFPLARQQRPRLALALCAILLAAAPAGGQALLGGETRLAFDGGILADLGVGRAAEATAPGAPPGVLGFAVSVADSAVQLAAPAPDFEGFAAADVRHAGRLVLTTPGGPVTLEGVRLVAAGPPHLLALVGSEGQTWLHVARPHPSWSADGGVLSLANADLLVAPALADRLGRPALTGSFVGVLEATWHFAPAPPGATTQGFDCIPDLQDPVDVELTVLASTTQAAREPGGRVALAPAAELTNNGPGDVAWNQAIAPASPVGPHPYLSLALYRLADGVLEQIGRSDLKHAFFATNTGCTCAGGNVLYAGCDDQYGVSTNLNQTHLAPRVELDALARAWQSLGSHFDATPVDDVRDHFGAGDHDDYEHRLVVQEPDLQTPGARYFVEAWYLAPNDTQLLNSLGHREVGPNLSSSTWAFPNVSAMALGSILDVWVDPQSPGPGEASALVDTGQGRVQVAAVATDLGGGLHHYEWALLNFDLGGQVRSFSVPVLPQMSVSNAGFGDGDASAANDWTVEVGPHRVVWSAPPDGALDWGRLAGFRMDVDAAPVDSSARLLPLETGGPFLAPTLAPAPGPDSIPALPWPLVLSAGLALGLALLARRPTRR